MSKVKKAKKLSQALDRRSRVIQNLEKLPEGDLIILYYRVSGGLRIVFDEEIITERKKKIAESIWQYLEYYGNKLAGKSMENDLDVLDETVLL